MAINQPYFLMREGELTVSPNASSDSYGTFVAALAAHSARVLKFGFQPAEERRPRLDTRLSRGVREIIQTMQTVEWDVESELLTPGGSTALDLEALVQMSLHGTAAATGTPGRQIPIADTQAIPQATIVATDQQQVMQIGVVGAVVDKFKISATGSETIKLNWSGPGRRWILAGRGATSVNAATATLLLESISAGPTPIIPGDWRGFTEGALVEVVGVSNNHTIISPPTSNQIIIDSTITTSLNDVVQPWTPWDITMTGGSPVEGINGSIDLGTGALEDDVLWTDYEIEVDNGLSVVEAGARLFIEDVLPNDRILTGKVTMFARRDDIIRMGSARQIANKDSTVIFGPAAGNRLTLDLNNVQYHWPESIDMPDTGPAKFVLPFHALLASDNPSAAADFEMVWETA